MSQKLDEKILLIRTIMHLIWLKHGKSPGPQRIQGVRVMAKIKSSTYKR